MLLLPRFGLSCSFDGAIAFVSGMRSARVYVLATTVALSDLRAVHRFEDFEKLDVPQSRGRFGWLEIRLVAVPVGNVTLADQEPEKPSC
jgi:hypothetical protein